MNRSLLLVVLDHRVCRGLALAWMALIFYLSAQPSLQVPSLVEGQDKVMHFVTYAVLGFLATGAASPGRETFSWKRVMAAAIFTLFYGISDEFHQSFVPGRSASVFDLLADGLGGVAGAGLARYLSRLPGRKRGSDEIR